MLWDARRAARAQQINEVKSAPSTQAMRDKPFGATVCF